MKTVGMNLMTVDLIVTCTWACSVTSWHPYSLEKRLFLADLVVIGTDIRHVTRNSTVGRVDSEFKVTCVLKGDNQVIEENIIIGEIEPRNSCQGTVTEVGVMYIIGLKRSENNMYEWHEVGIMQPAAAPYTDDSIKKALTVCGLQDPTPPSNVTRRHIMGSCPEVDPDASCTDGAEYTLAQKVIVAISSISIVFIVMGVLATLWVTRFISRKANQRPCFVQLVHTNEQTAITETDERSSVDMPENSDTRDMTNIEQ